MKKLILLVVIASALFSSCQKNNSPAPDAKNAPGGTNAKNRPALTTDVYVAGDFTAQAGNGGGYFKNGIAVRLPSAIDVQSITVSGNDVYVTGAAVGTGGQEQAAYWKNDTVHLLSYGTKANFTSFGIDIAVVGSDVYVAGQYFDGDRRQQWAMLWKNGVAQNLAYNNFPSSAHCVIVKNNNVYVAGYSELDATNSSIGTYWINGAHGRVRSAKAISWASGAAVNNRGDMYISGYNSATLNSPSTATYFTDGVVETDLSPADTSIASRIVLNNGDIYVSGTLIHQFFNTLQQHTQACYWKNGVRTLLGTVGGNEGVDMAVAGTDIYVLATEEAGNNGTSVVYKNGIRTEIPNFGARKFTVVQH